MTSHDTASAAWPPRRIDLGTPESRAAALPPSLESPAQIRALRDAYRLGFAEGEVSSEAGHYVAGWRFGVVCGFVAGGAFIAAMLKLGHLAGLTS